MTTELVKQEVEFLQSSLENLRINGEISNDAYLDAGAVEGGLSMLANLIELGIAAEEIQDLLRQLHERAGRIDEAHPNLGPAVASCRQ
ncbi:MAG: hypothetical protein H8D82_00850 [Euryarchaeota archaeon]|nr:hypothetical protein [Euryarchaeota archaeon]